MKIVLNTKNNLIHKSIFKLIAEQCSHAYSYMLYTYSVYHKTTLTAVNCSSWSDFQHNKCINNKTIFMGHETPPR
jgi:hypothetical protein